MGNDHGKQTQPEAGEVERMAALFDEACCVVGQGDFMRLEDYRVMLFQWIIGRSPGGSLGALHDACMSYKMGHLAAHPSIRLSAGTWKNRFIVGMGLRRFPTEKLMEKYK